LAQGAGKVTKGRARQFTGAPDALRISFLISYRM
jgi:hypothetical protein